MKRPPVHPTSWAADTSWLYGLLDGDDVFHATAREEAAHVGVVFVNPVILMEFLDVVRAKKDREASLKAHDALLWFPQLRHVEAPKLASMARVMERHAGIGWHDASAICTALDEGAGLRTFDVAQRKAFEALR